MACGKPIILTSLPGILKEFGEGNGVVYVDAPEKVLEMAFKIVKMGFEGEYSTKARRFVNKSSWNDIV